ncbi:PREDICTED: tripartite motif-containing protein 2-like [Branchiostoma belcheri]|uniref:RING-type E3 ubiquitin transferase n=1 Tax=Branchiostoma belcheri TaxID=7741 RepID=A0A6P4YP83_BRABE|nr:PREDICTED: tripartite motif-containing protein 2-like [Branchiostoma belcheri]
MASKMANDMDRQSLTCQICMSLFRAPKILPCLHSFCRECLQELATKQQPLECPTCRKPVSLPDQGVDGLKNNFYVSNLLDFAAVKKGAGPGVPCQVCEGGQDGGKSWCVDCATWMCGACTTVHRKLPGTKEHEVVPAEVLKAEKDVSKFQRKRHCHKHKNQELVFYCESCNALVCTACTVVDHRPGTDHNPVEVSAIADDQKDKLRQLLSQVDPRLEEMQEALKEFDKEMMKLDSSRIESVNQATSYFQHLADLLQKREREILSQIDSTYRGIGKTLESQKEEVELGFARLASARTFCGQAVDHGDEMHLVEVGEQAQRRVEGLLQERINLKPEQDKVQFSERVNVADFKKDVERFGIVSSTVNVDVSKCRVVTKTPVVGLQCTSVLETADEEGQAVAVNREAITATLTGPAGTRAVPTLLQARDEGRVWDILYTPEVTGRHRLEVKVKDRDVAGSPFDVMVRSRDSAVITIGREGSEEGQVKKPIDVAIDGEGKVVVLEQVNRRIQVFNAEHGNVLKCFPIESEGLFGTDTDSSGNLFVTSYGASFGVRKYSREGELLATFNPEYLRHPLGVAVLKDGRMVAADKQQKSCLLLQPDGSLIREIGKGQLQDPWFIAIDESRGLMFVTDNRAHKVVVFDLEGNLRFSFGKRGQNPGELSSPTGVTLDPAGNVIVANKADGRVQVFGPDGRYLRTVTTSRGAPHGLALTPEGYVAVACYTGHCVELYRYK